MNPTGNVQLRMFDICLRFGSVRFGRSQLIRSLHSTTSIPLGNQISKRIFHRNTFLDTFQLLLDQITLFWKSQNLIWLCQRCHMSWTSKSCCRRRTSPVSPSFTNFFSFQHAKQIIFSSQYYKRVMIDIYPSRSFLLLL